MHTLLAVRTAKLCELFQASGKPWIIENPPELEDKPSIFRLGEFLALAKSTKVTRTFLSVPCRVYLCEAHGALREFCCAGFALGVLPQQFLVAYPTRW